MILIDPADLRKIVDAAETAYPEEACGLLVGSVRGNGEITVAAVHPARNVAAEPRHRFEVDPALHLALQRNSRADGTRVVGLFHSHPDHSAQPSATDLAEGIDPDLVWLITSVVQGQAVLTAAHVLDAAVRQFRPIPLRTTDWQPYPSRSPKM